MADITTREKCEINSKLVFFVLESQSHDKIRVYYFHLDDVLCVMIGKENDMFTTACNHLLFLVFLTTTEIRSTRKKHCSPIISNLNAFLNMYEASFSFFLFFFFASILLIYEDLDGL